MTGNGIGLFFCRSIFMVMFLPAALFLKAQPESIPDFMWGNASYFNLNTGETVLYANTEIKLLSIRNQFNILKVGKDTITCRVSRRTLPENTSGLRIFVADNLNIRLLSASGHGLLKKEALICVSLFNLPLLNSLNYVFPISFNDGYVWSCEEDSYIFSFRTQKQSNCDSEGIDFDFQNLRGTEKHRAVAVEKATVEWIFENRQSENEASVLLKSLSQQNIYYLYNHLYRKKLEVRKGQLVEKGELVGAVWGDSYWAHLSFQVIYSEKLPEPGCCPDDVVNGFPQVFELHFNTSVVISRNYKKGRIFFGKNSTINGNQKNASEFEDYLGKGWMTADWNISEKVETVSKGAEGNIRLRKVIFSNTPARAVNPRNYSDYEICVPDGNYRIRAKAGDVELPSWQKIAFEGVETNEISNEKGQFSWTSERVVKVTDGRLTIRIYFDESNSKVAGLSEIVFQPAG